jgi:hypothetical protein
VAKKIGENIMCNHCRKKNYDKPNCFKLLTKNQVEETVRDEVSGSPIDVKFNKMTAKMVFITVTVNVKIDDTL